MSKSIQIRNVPEAVHAALRARAGEAGVSLSEYMLREATRVAKRPSNAEVLTRATDRDWGVAPGAATEAVRAIRDGPD